MEIKTADHVGDGQVLLKKTKKSGISTLSNLISDDEEDVAEGMVGQLSLYNHVFPR